MNPDYPFLVLCRDLLLTILVTSMIGSLFNHES